MVSRTPCLPSDALRRLAWSCQEEQLLLPPQLPPRNPETSKILLEECHLMVSAGFKLLSSNSGWKLPWLHSRALFMLPVRKIVGWIICKTYRSWIIRDAFACQLLILWLSSLPLPCSVLHLDLSYYLSVSFLLMIFLHLISCCVFQRAPVRLRRLTSCLGVQEVWVQNTHLTCGSLLWVLMMQPWMLLPVSQPSWLIEHSAT